MHSKEDVVKKTLVDVCEAILEIRDRLDVLSKTTTDICNEIGVMKNSNIINNAKDTIELSKIKIPNLHNKFGFVPQFINYNGKISDFYLLNFDNAMIPKEDDNFPEEGDFIDICRYIVGGGGHGSSLIIFENANGMDGDFYFGVSAVLTTKVGYTYDIYAYQWQFGDEAIHYFIIRSDEIESFYHIRKENNS